MADLPVELGYGYVRARFLLADADSAEDPDDLPDGRVPPDMRVELTPKVAQVLIDSGTSEPVMVLKKTLDYGLDENGNMIDSQGLIGIKVVEGAYSVKYRNASLPPHDLVVTTEHTAASPNYLLRSQPPAGPAPTQSQYAELRADLDALMSSGGEGGPHLHSWSVITDKPNTYPPTAHAHVWGDITGRPSTYPPSTHAHTISDVSGLQQALDDAAASGGGGGGTADSVEWASVLNKPTNYPPTAHTHTQAEVTGLTATLNTKVTGTGITEIQALTQAQYDVLPVPRPTNVLYVVVG